MPSLHLNAVAPTNKKAPRHPTAIRRGFLFASSTIAAAKERVVVYAATWFQARDSAFSNVVVIPYDGPNARSVEQALKVPAAVKMTIQGNEFMGPGESFVGTLDEDKQRLTVEYTDRKGKSKTKTFKLFSPGWTSPNQLR